MLGALISSAILWILMVVIAKDELFGYRQALIVVVIGGLASFLVFGALADSGKPILLARAAGIFVGLLPIYLYLTHLGYNRSLVLKVLLYFVLVNVAMSGVHYLMDMPVDVAPHNPE